MGIGAGAGGITIVCRSTPTTMSVIFTAGHSMRLSSPRPADVVHEQLPREARAAETDFDRLARLQGLEQLAADERGCRLAFDVERHHPGIGIVRRLRPRAS